MLGGRTAVFSARPGEAQGAGRHAPTTPEASPEASPLWRRVFTPRNALSFVLAGAVLFLALRQGAGFDWRGVWAEVSGANAGLLVLAFGVFYATFPVRAWRWGVLLGNVGYGRGTRWAMPSGLGLARILYLAWFVNCVVVARLGDAYRGYLLKRASGVSFAATLGTVVAERLLDLSVLAMLLSATALVAFGGALPDGAAGAPAAALALSVAGVAGLLAMRPLGRVAARLVPRRHLAPYRRFEDGTLGSFRRVGRLVALSVAGWALEGASLFLVAAAVGAGVGMAGALAVALVASLLSVVPFTPAGLGVAEAGMVAALLWLGLDAGSAGAVALLGRAISYWSIVVLGFGLYLYTARHPVGAATTTKPASRGGEGSV